MKHTRIIGIIVGILILIGLIIGTVSGEEAATGQQMQRPPAPVSN